LIFLGENMLKKYKITEYDFTLVAMVVGLTSFGVLVISSASSTNILKYILGMAFCIAVMVFVSLCDYTFILQYYWCYYIANLVLLALIFIPGVGVNLNNSTRWVEIPIGHFRFQPSEAAKILLILFFAQFIMKYKDKVKKFGFILVCLLLLAIPLFMIFKQPDLSTCIVIFTVFSCMLIIGGMDWRLIATALAVAVPAVFFAIYDAANGLGIVFGKILKEYMGERILVWLHPENYTLDGAYQTINSITAIGSGQLYGKGYNSTDASSVLNAGFIAEAQSDFIFAAIGEEFGFIGGCAVIIVLLMIAVRCFMISRRAKDKAGQLLAAGVGAWVGFQGFINISVATGLFPNTGLPLPFLSAGLTSWLSIYVGIGFVLNVRLQSNKYI